MSDSYVKENLAHIEARIQAACNRCGRSRDEVLLIAVSKTKPVSMIREAIQAGIRDFGENKVQELCEKYEEIHGTEKNGEVIQPPLNWHLIGHLQRNKVKYIVDKACLIHSVDSLRLAEEIQKREREIDIREDQLNNYLNHIGEEELTEPEQKDLTLLLRLILEFERIGDYAVNLVEEAETLHNQNVRFSDKALEELEVI